MPNRALAPRLIGAAAALLLSATAAAAHPELEASNPAANGHVSVSVKEVRLDFSEAVSPAFSGVVIKDAKGAAVATGKASVDPKDKTVLVVPLKAKLAPGNYKVEWHAVSSDTHRITGSFAFMAM
ncbi:copper homeostasis periplasmic binding protein CopC [Caulobacter sp. 17J65-9]|uniref:copper homeostasis periplasmic binding protein CopC n=1 Tax=Caulobacter sp. 17J65-9 TaxID=2709382 RepID=UPI0013C77933|nr:copper homeostasis periplasmic binding protein CopC [Caulobacter sp. 17J65-9]NEX91250.1 copper homeostasis periplasmic binding protein CopC [Caulobacter sp. 17J65-9]